MATNWSDFMKGFSSYGHSFNRSAIAHDEELHREFQEELENGRLQCNRVRTLIVGEKGVGKTSLLQMMTGSCCDPSAPVKSTEGIDIMICQTSDEDPAWVRVEGPVDTIRADDPVMCAAWNVCKKDKNTKGLFKKPQGNDDRAENQQQKRARGGRRSAPDKKQDDDQKEHDFKDSWTLMRKFWYFMKVNLILVTLVIIGMHEGFGPFVWLVVMSYFVHMDFNSAYRFGTGSALAAILVDDI